MAALDASTLHGYPRYQTLQPLYNLYDREVFEKELETEWLQNNIGVIPYFSSGSAF
jgi:aryl-alcohol dehydrogenase-like predicted oxidoreductase